MSRFSITTRLIALALIMLGVLFATNYFLSGQLSRSADLLVDEAKLVSRLTAANRTNKAFGDLKYWLTDLSVSQLMSSERGASEARARLNAMLAKLQESDPEAVASIVNEVEALETQMFLAVDAYAEDSRVIGNSLMSKARNHINTIDKHLVGIVTRLEAEALKTSDTGVLETGQAVSRSTSLVITASILGFGLTLFILRSITGPLRKLVASMQEITRGNLNVEMPPETHDEIGSMTRTLRLFRDGQLETARLAREREMAQVARETAENQLREAIESISEAFVLFDAQDNLVLCNQKYRELYADLDLQIGVGLTYQQLCVAIATSGVVVNARKNPQEWIAERLERHRSPTGSQEHQRADGRWVRVSERKTNDGGTVGVVTDISDLKSREAQLGEMVEHLEDARDQAMQATRAKSQFLANMSHELRTPLNAIIGYSEMLAEDAQDNGNAQDVADLGKIHSAGRHLLTLINEILDLAKIEVGKMDLYLEEVEISPLVEELASTVEPMMHSRGNALTLRVEPGLGAMHTDQTKLRQILLNLLSNAAKFTNRGEIVLSVTGIVHEQDPWLEFVVEDTGIGMTDEQRSRIFEEFSQADASTTREYGGTGLGLSITRHFCEMLAGTIQVKSKQGQGSAFTVRVPLQTPTIEMPVGSPGGPVSFNDSKSTDDPVDTNQCQVLVIDDDPAVRELITRFLSKEGFRVLTAATGREGLEIAKTAKPDLVSLDVLMPGMDGWTVLKHLKADPDTADTPVLMVSIVDEKKIGYALGATDFLTKPIDRASLLRVVARHCGKDFGGPVLVVDDDPSVRDMVTKMLEREGVDSIPAEHGRHALQMLGQVLPQLILLDLMMPEMDGFEFLEEIKSKPQWRAIPVVVVTAKDLTDEDHLRLNGKVRAVISKGSYAESDLLTTLRNAIRKVSSEQNNSSNQES